MMREKAIVAVDKMEELSKLMVASSVSSMNEVDAVAMVKLKNTIRSYNDLIIEEAEMMDKMDKKIDDIMEMLRTYTKDVKK